MLAPIHNRKQTTLGFMRSFCRQTYKNYQVVIVDDGSTDGSSEAIKAEFPETVILKGDGNLWWTGSMNMGVEFILSVATPNDYVLAINDDVTVRSDYLEKIVSASEDNNNAIVGSLYKDAKDEDIIYDSGVKIDWEKYRYSQVQYSKEHKIVGNLDTLATRGVLIPISVIRRIGIFEKRLRHYAADYEYFFRAKKQGYRLYMSYEAVVYGTEEVKESRKISRFQSPAKTWKKVFSIKSPTNIENHLFIIWHYCPNIIYRLKHMFSLIAYNCFLLVASVSVYPISMLIEKVVKLFTKQRRV